MISWLSWIISFVISFQTRQSALAAAAVLTFGGDFGDREIPPQVLSPVRTDLLTKLLDCTVIEEKIDGIS